MMKAMLRFWGAVLALALAGSVFAQDPQRITIVVPYPAGGLSDNLARMTATVLSRNMGLPVIVDNRPGANGSIGLQAVAAAKPDGATIGLVPASVMTTNPFLYKDLKVDPVKDVAPLTLALTLPNVLVVNPDKVRAKSFPELVEMLRSQQGASFGSMGAGSSAHLNGEMLQHDARLVLTHVPYKGSAPVMNDLLAGIIPMAFDNLPVALPYIRSGKLRALGVTSLKPSPQAPDVPPISQWLPGFEDNIWFGYVAPNGLSPAMAKRLHDELAKAVRSDEVARAMHERGATVITSTPDEMRRTILDEQKKWSALIKERGIRID
ncbi:Bug family tripartite tricarboxylate transporter substrate binding protein [Xenophilus azovorans]|uniref:Bug family tripartite tricarboxylate transporter substrate binding protein n=1 Tax=Xenophilus azovorans TaxID=151755 RepID=UPI00056E0761|nr:tripartite tricarboxylate transporter substrate-binding protein [Xenophilus azovorans]